MTKHDRKNSLRVLSYNIHKGFGSGSVRFVLRSIRNAIRSVHADLVFLQEVVGHNSQYASRIEAWPRESQFEFMADEVWDHHAYGKNAVYFEEHHGNAILSKFPIKSWENIDISTNRLERRGLLHAVIDWQPLQKELHAICLHFDISERGRRKQIEQLCDRIRHAVPPRSPVIVAGDFNDWRLKVSSQLQEKLNLDEVFICLKGSHPRTFPVWLPLLRLDRIYFRGLDPLSAECLTESPWGDLSDHAAIYAEFGIRGEGRS